MVGVRESVFELELLVEEVGARCISVMMLIVECDNVGSTAN